MAAWIRNFLSQKYPPSPKFTDADVPDQTGRVFLVTGGNTGIGYEVCKTLCSKGGTVYMASRNKTKAEAAIASIVADAKTSGAGAQVKFLPLDLADLSTVREAARLFASQETRLDVLWLNACLQANGIPPGARTPTGVDLMAYTGCVAHLLLAQLLRPQLEKASLNPPPPPPSTSLPADKRPARVVWYGSHLIDMNSPRGGVDFEILDRLPEGRKAPGGNLASYSASKAGCMFLAYEMSRRWGSGDGGVLSVCLNPGDLATQIYDGTPEWVMKVLRFVVLNPPHYGAYTALYAGLSPEVTIEKHSGSYIYPWGRLSDYEKDWRHRPDIVKAMRGLEEGGEGKAARMWEWCERVAAMEQRS